MSDVNIDHIEAVVVLIVCALLYWAMCVDSARREREQGRAT